MRSGPPILFATYDRVLSVSVERIWENVLDWEHLPGLHRQEFASVRLVESGEWGWVARVRPRSGTESRAMTVRVVLDRDRLRYLTATVEGPGAGTEIWTRLTPRSERETQIHVEFLVPEISPAGAARRAAVYRELYARLWDEDEAMMLRRDRMLARSLAERSSRPARVDLGSLEDLRARLPLLVEMGDRPFRIVAIDGDLVVHSTVCPHQLGPLEDAPVEDGELECPWHGYRFDVRTGRSCDRRSFRLARPPRLAIDACGGVSLIAAEGDEQR